MIQGDTVRPSMWRDVRKYILNKTFNFITIQWTIKQLLNMWLKVALVTWDASECYYVQSYKSLCLGWSVATKPNRVFSNMQGNQWVVILSVCSESQNLLACKLDYIISLLWSLELWGGEFLFYGFNSHDFCFLRYRQKQLVWFGTDIVFRG